MLMKKKEVPDAGLVRVSGAVKLAESSSGGVLSRVTGKGSSRLVLRNEPVFWDWKRIYRFLPGPGADEPRVFRRTGCHRR